MSDDQSIVNFIGFEDVYENFQLSFPLQRKIPLPPTFSEEG